MDNRQGRTHVAFRRAHVFLSTKPVQPEPPLLTRMREALETCLTRLAELRVEQIGAHAAMRGNARQLEQMRQHIRRERMMPLVRIAKPLLRFAPGTERALHVPHARADTLTVASHAVRLAKTLAPHAKLIVSAGYEKTFLPAFRREAEELAAAVRTVEKAREQRARVTAAIDAEVKKGMKTLMVIEGILMSRFPGKSEVMSGWRRARRVPARLGRPRSHSAEGRTLSVNAPAPS